MATNQYSRPVSDLAIHPGELLREEIECIGMTQRELAKRMGRPPQAVNEIVKGKKSITHDTAIELENVLGIPAHIWINSQTSYDFTLARLSAREQWAAQAKDGWLDQFPVSEIEKRGWIERYKDKADKVGALLNFLGVASFDAWRKQEEAQPVLGFRISENSKVSPVALSVWLRQGELEGRDIETAEYDEQAFISAIKQIRAMTSDTPEDFVPKMTRLCADAGVAVALVPELPKSGANGVARWISPGKGLIQMSLRWRWHDIFWFSFFHECHHILIHKVQKVHIDGINNDTEEETAANSFAANFLIPPDEYERFVASNCYDEASVSDFAARIGIDPGIVVGRMQREKLIRYNQLANLKKRYTWVTP